MKTQDVKKAAANDVEKESTNDQIIEQARQAVEEAKTRLSEARSELRRLTGKKEAKGPGVIASILTMVEQSGKSGITKEVLLDKLVELFPDRSREGMSKTIAVQLPGRMSKEKGVKIDKTDKGAFYISK